MVTFGAWLEGQKNRQDPIGELARYWLTLKGNRRVRALPSVRAELEAAGALAEGSPVAAWWEATEAAWRAYKNTPTSISGRPLASVPEPSDEPPAGHAPGTITLETVQATLDAHTAFLAAIAVKLGLSAAQVAEIAARTLGEPRAAAPDPVDWNWAFDHADFEEQA